VEKSGLTAVELYKSLWRGADRPDFSTPDMAKPCPPVEMTTVRRYMQAIVCAVIALIAGFVVYHGLARCDFIWFDDPIHVFTNPYLNPLTNQGVAHLWLHPYKGLYIPLSYTGFAGLVGISHFLGHGNVSDTGAALDPRIFHVANVCIHEANILLVYLLLRRLFKSDWPSLAGALVFALHPVQVESVAWVSEFRGLLAAFLILLSALTYIGRTRCSATRYALALFLFVLALLAKPSAAITPLLLAIWAIAVHRGQARRIVFELAPWLLLSGLDLWLTRSVQPPVDSIDTALWIRPLIAGDTLVFYLGKVFAPTRLTIDYGHTPAMAMANHIIYLSWLLPVGIGAASFFARKRAPWVLTGLLTSLIVVLPVLGLVPFTYQYFSTVADRYLYLAMIGPAILIASACASIEACGSVAVRRVAFVAIVAVLLVLGMAARRQCGTWKNTDSVMRQVLAVNPLSATAHLQLGQSYSVSGQTLRALGEFRTAARLRPEMYIAHFDIGNELMNTGDMDGAIDEFATAIRIQPDYASAHLNLARALIAIGRNAQALEEIDTTEHLAPHTVLLHFYRGNALMGLGNLDEALSEFQAEMKQKHRFAAAYVNAGVILVRLRRPTEAVGLLQTAISIGPAKTAWYTDLAAAQFMAGRVDAARATVKRVLDTSPNDTAAHALERAMNRF